MQLAAVGLAAVLGTFPFLLMLLSLAINYAYSAGPLRLSYRTYLAPLILAVAYVLIPYSFGAWLAGYRPGRTPLSSTSC